MDWMRAYQIIDRDGKEAWIWDVRGQSGSNCSWGHLELTHCVNPS